MASGFEPRIVGFLCNWCTYAGADLAGTSRRQYPPNMLPIRVMCSSAVNPVYIVRALLGGADGMFIGGCHPGDCHYQTGNYYTRRRFAVAKTVFKELGLEADRVRLSWISASEGTRFAQVVAEFTKELAEAGPNAAHREVFL